MITQAYLIKRRQDNFFKKVFPEPNTGCWIWAGRINKKGYGLGFFNIEGRITLLAHRFSYYIHNNFLDKNLLVCHKCDVPQCVNPDHLFLGTAYENNIDRDRKGRLVSSKGSKNGNASLNESQVLEIRYLYSTKLHTSRHLAKVYNVSQFAIMCIIKNKTWKHI